MFNTNKITHLPAGDVPYILRTIEEVCGKVEGEQNDDLPGSPGPRAGYVRFINGARTKWHRHDGLQVLFVTEGLGFVEQEGLPRIEIKPGDRIYIPKKVLHCHGAKKGQQMVHLAFTDGETDWDKKDPCE